MKADGLSELGKGSNEQALSDGEESTLQRSWDDDVKCHLGWCKSAVDIDQARTSSKKWRFELLMGCTLSL